jgi:AcrR family transcriptional regulator
VTAAKPTVAAGVPRRVGRPRSAPSHRMGVSGREQILDAAGRMFSEQGYGAASTRKIAMAVGVKQASLYYHFTSKEDILAGLLAGTVEPSLAFAAKLACTDEPAHIQLYALTYFDVSLLCSARWNVGALYHLPELRGARFAQFRSDRQLLRHAYGQRIADGERAGIFAVASAEVATSLVFALAESVIAMRSDDVPLDAALPELTAAGCLRLLSCDEQALCAAAMAGQRLQALAPSLAN